MNSGAESRCSIRHDSLPNKSIPTGTDALLNLNPDLDLNGRRMSVVNLEAVLTNWKSIRNSKVAHCSETYRNRLSAEARISPSSVGALPPQLFRFLSDQN